MRIRADPDGRHRIRSFQPRYPLVVALQTYKNERRRIDGDCTAMVGRAKRAATSVIMLRLGRSRLRFRRGHRFGADRRHIERIGDGVSDHAKCRDRCNELHQNRQQHDWNKYFQPPPHDFPINAAGHLTPALPHVEITCGGAPMRAPGILSAQEEPRGNKFELPELLLLTLAYEPPTRKGFRS